MEGFEAFLRASGLPYLVFSSFVLFGMVFGAFELVEMLLLKDTPHDQRVFLHLSRGITLTFVLIGWVS